MNKHIKKQLDSKQRVIWNLSPVTIVVPNKKSYNRAANKKHIFILNDV